MVSIKQINNLPLNACEYNDEYFVELTDKSIIFNIFSKNKVLKEECVGTKRYIPHPNSNKIFLLIINDLINIYIISDNYDKIRKISSLKNYSSNITFASFNPYEENILISNSKDKDNNNILSIWDLYNGLIKQKYKLNIGDLSDIQFEKNLLLFILNQEILVYNYNNNSITHKIKFEDEVSSFQFINNSNIIITTLQNIIFYSLESSEIIFQEDETNSITSIFIHDFSLLVRFLFDSIIIYHLFEKNGKFTLNLIFTKNQSLLKYNNINFKSFKEQKNFLVLEFIAEKLKKYYKISIEFPLSEDINKTEKTSPILGQNIKNIIDFDCLKLFQPNKNYFRNYYNIPEIQAELSLIKNVDLYKRKSFVEENVEKLNINNLNEKYLQLIKLLIRDNTNGKLLKEYLLFIKENENYLKKEYNEYYEEYEKELNYYKRFFSKDKFSKYFKKNKNSEKEELLELFKHIIDLESNASIKKELELITDDYKTQIFFNQPLDTEINDELFYFNLKLNVMYYFSELIKEKDEIYLNQVLGNYQERFIKIRDIIIKNLNKEEIEYLIFSAIFTNNKKNFNFCINCLKCENINYLKSQANNNKDIQEVIDEYVINNKDIKLIKEMNCILYKNKIYFDYQDICYNNLINYSGLYYANSQVYNLDYMIKNPPNNLNLEKIKKFLIKIINSNCFKSAFTILYGKEQQNIFSDEKYNTFFINKYFSFIPMNSEDISFTNKFTMKTYLNSFNFKFKSNYSLSEEEMIYLKYGLSVLGSIHEIGHNITNNLYYLSNCTKPIDTPRNAYLENGEGGEYIELIFFGKIINLLNFRQACFLLNENNYNKTCFDFQKNFEELKTEDLTIKDGIFIEEFKKISIHKNLDFDNIYIQAKKSKYEEPSIYCNIKNDVIGKKFIK